MFTNYRAQNKRLQNIAKQEGPRQDQAEQHARAVIKFSQPRTHIYFGFCKTMGITRREDNLRLTTNVVTYTGDRL